jgi:hypothetical protein
MWESRLGLGPGELNKRMYDVWHGGSIGTISEHDVHQAVTERFGLDKRQLAEFMADIWREYLGTANTELIEYARRLRPRYRNVRYGKCLTVMASARRRQDSPACRRTVTVNVRACPAAQGVLGFPVEATADSVLGW